MFDSYNKKIVALTGAGISKASGIPTFRGKDGLWNKYRAEDLANPEAFRRNPKVVWNWYKARMRILLSAQPNAAHLALAKLEKEHLLVGLITQNVDGLHKIAGNKNVIEVHGNIRYARCDNCDYKQRWDTKELADENSELLRCPTCHSLLRPDVVWFGEPLDSDKWQKAVELTKQCDMLLVIGTSAVVYPVASLPLLAKQNGAKVIEFNITSTPITRTCDRSYFGPAEETLPKFVNSLLEEMNR